MANMIGMEVVCNLNSDPAGPLPPAEGRAPGADAPPWIPLQLDLIFACLNLFKSLAIAIHRRDPPGQPDTATAGDAAVLQPPVLRAGNTARVGEERVLS